MSKMADLVIEIQDLVLNGYEAEDIALMCEVPVAWVYEAMSMAEDMTAEE